jgi:hypothetical protein
MTSPSFLDLQDETLRHLDEATATGATTRALVKDFLNQAHRYRCTNERWPFMLWEGAETFTTVAAQSAYTLHPEFHRPLYMWNRTRNEFLVELPFRALENIEPYTVVVSNPLRYTLWNRSPVAAQPSAASTISVVSTSTADTGSTYAVTIRGISSSNVVTTTLTPSGTTTTATTTTFTKILNITLGAACAGTLTFTAGSTTLLTLSPGEFSRTYPVITLLDLPSTADVIEYRFFRQPLKLVNNYDIPDIPAPHSTILVFDALLLFAGYNTEINEKSIKVWSELRDRMERAMSNDLVEGSSVGAQARFVRRMDTDGSTMFPHINMTW